MSGFSGTERSLGKGERSETGQSRNQLDEVIKHEAAFIGSFHQNTKSFANPMIIQSPPLREEVTPLKSSTSQRKIQTIVTQNNLNRQAFNQVQQSRK